MSLGFKIALILLFAAGTFLSLFFKEPEHWWLNVTGHLMVLTCWLILIYENLRKDKGERSKLNDGFNWLMDRIFFGFGLLFLWAYAGRRDYNKEVERRAAELAEKEAASKQVKLADELTAKEEKDKDATEPK